MRAKSGDTPGAIADLNVIRKRAGAKEYTPDENLEEAIALEREKELFLEGICTRYFDIVRCIIIFSLIINGLRLKR